MLKPAIWHMTTTVQALTPPSGGGLVSISPSELLFLVTSSQDLEITLRLRTRWIFLSLLDFRSELWSVFSSLGEVLGEALDSTAESSTTQGSSPFSTSPKQDISLFPVSSIISVYHLRNSGHRKRI